MFWQTYIAYVHGVDFVQYEKIVSRTNFEKKGECQCLFLKNIILD